METVLITGANRGLGLELARQYAIDGWRVLACSRKTSDELSILARAHPALALHTLDVTVHRQIDELAAQLAGEPIDVLINNAGILGKRDFGNGAGTDQAFGNTDYADWERIFRTNVMGPMKMAEAFVEHVARSRQRRVVTLSSMLGSMSLNTTGGLYGYRASKAAVNALMKSMAIDLAERQILAVALHPGWVRTEMGGRNATLGIPESVAGMRQVIARLTPMDAGRLIAYDGTTLGY
jgi:NAD(P)-dependent dehydrogenase (short-subunit alcohol dehydrogenase family)